MDNGTVVQAAWRPIVKLSRSVFVISLAGVLAIGAAGAVLAATSSGQASGGQGVVPAAASPTPAPSVMPLKRPDTALDDALDTLVADGTITSQQKTKILAAVTAERQARVAERKALKDVRKADRQILKDALADGAITQDELDKLSADNPLRKATDLMADGKITKDELKSLRGQLKGVLGGGKGRGGHGAPGGNDLEASPAPTSGTSG
jgi:hypothetical protein